MKKINLFLSALLIALAVLVAGGTAVAPAVQLQAMSLNTAASTKRYDLFDSKGRYAVDKETLMQSINAGTVFNFFGYDWRVVYVSDADSEEQVATFWMASPYVKSYFNQITESAIGALKDSSNIWSNGYSGASWLDVDGETHEIGQSYVRTLLSNKAAELMKKYSKYSDKVRAGYVKGANDEKTEYPVGKLAYGDISTDSWVDTNGKLTAKIGLNENDYLWLPSINEIDTIWGNGKGLEENIVKWTRTTNGAYAWLRTPNLDDSKYALCVSAKGKEKLADDTEATLFHSAPIGENVKSSINVGVRPAVHLNIAKIAEEYQDHVDNPAGFLGWDNWDNWMKILFIVVCVLGLLGIAITIIAVVVKARKDKANANA